MNDFCSAINYICDNETGRCISEFEVCLKENCGYFCQDVGYDTGEFDTLFEREGCSCKTYKKTNYGKYISNKGWIEITECIPKEPFEITTWFIIKIITIGVIIIFVAVAFIKLIYKDNR